jgi:hypothetical protein
MATPCETEPIVYRITRKQAEKLIPILNKKNIWVESIDCYLNKNDIKTVAQVTTKTGCSAVYVSEDREGRLPHNLIRFSDDYIKQWGNNQKLYGNIICVLGQKAYESLPEHLKISDSNLNTIVL